MTCGFVERSDRSLDEPSGDMKDFWSISRLDVNKPISEHDWINQKLVELNERNEMLLGTDEHRDPAILKFQLHLLTASDDEGRNLLSVACQYGLHLVVKFIVKKAVQFGVF